MDKNLIIIKNLCKEHGLSTRQLSMNIGVSYQNLSSVLSGSKPIGGILLSKIGRYFGIQFTVKYPK